MNKWCIKRARFANAGVSTVELALIFPVVLMMVMIMIALLYHFARASYLQTVVDDVLKHASAMSMSPNSTFGTGFVGTDDFQDTFLFEKTCQFFSNPILSENHQMSSALKAYLRNHLNEYQKTLDPLSENEVSITVEQFLLFKKVRIEIYGEDKSIFNRAFAFFLQKSPPPLAQGEIMLSDTPEMIRNLDFACSFIEETDEAKGMAEQLSKIKELILEFIRNPLGSNGVSNLSL